MDPAIIQFHSLNLTFLDNSINVSLKNEADGLDLTGSIGLKRLLDKSEKQNVKTTEKCLTADFVDSTLKIEHSLLGGQLSSAQRYDITWESTTAQEFMDEFDYGESHWYGVAQVNEQLWPIEKWERNYDALVCKDSYEADFGGVQERYWLSSSGAAIFVDSTVPLFVAMNANESRKLNLKAEYQTPYSNANAKQLTLRYSIFQAADAKSVHCAVISSRFIEKPLGVPNESIFKYPIWTTWARYKKDIDQKTVLEFAKEIRINGFKASQLEIDDDWTPKYGDMTFNSSKFPNPKAMMAQLRDLEFDVTLWVHPFCSLDSKAAGKPYWLNGENGQESTWWNGQGKCLDITNPEAVSWFKASLQSLKDNYGVASFKFDAGEINWLPKNATEIHKMAHPNEYTTKWANIAYELDKTERRQEVRVGLSTQHLPIFVRMMDKDSNWGYKNGLKTLIPHCLTFGLIGYPFVLPDMIGGNAYLDEFPDPELFIRWLQVNLFMPALQFSICPWNYDENILKISLDMMELRSKYDDKIISLAKESVRTGFPINRPLWWIAPKDEDALTVDSEFLLGDDLLVAPVLEKGATSRDIYLPNGTWRDEITGDKLEGGRWVKDYPAPLNVIPNFTLVASAKM